MIYYTQNPAFCIDQLIWKVEVGGLVNLSFAKRLWTLFKALINHVLSGIQAQLSWSVDFVMSATEETINTTLCKHCS